MLARFSSLELLAKTVVEGLLIGLHRSPHFGFSQEFAEYRAYNEGDDLRFVDWNVYARSDRTYIKRFRGDTNTRLMLALDASASMGYGSGYGKGNEAVANTKFDYARYLCASLAWLARKQHDAVGAVVFDDTVRAVQPPSSRPDTLPRLLAMLEHLESSSGTDVVEALQSLHRVSGRRGLLAVVSDFYAEPEQFIKAIQPLAQSGHDIALFHIVDPREQQPDFQAVTSLRDVESGRRIDVDPDYLIGPYREKFAAHQKQLADMAGGLGADYTLVNTAEPLDQTLGRYLRFRQRKL
ncbi:MAG: DUF58 domain-containing protein [Gammaproteobacteria bacterium]|nr:DUF58 domain-containing protein [Gammaproteobacteria bacterium]